MRYLTILFILVTSCQSARNSKTQPIVYIHNADKFLLSDKFDHLGNTIEIKEPYPNGLIKSVGHIAIDRNRKVSNLKVGEWKEYYDNGQIKSEGIYQIRQYKDCGVGGPEMWYYNIKSGYWTYFYENGNLEAEGEYQIIPSFIKTRCEGGDSLEFGITSPNWKFNNERGETLQLNQIKDFKKYESTLLDFYDFSFSYHYDREKREVIHNLSENN